MDVFQEYKPIRNRMAHLSIEEALGTIWAYCQYLQLDDFRFPPEIEVSPAFLNLDVPQRWISEWHLELLAKELLLNGSIVSTKGRSLRNWSTLSDIVNSLKNLEFRIYREFCGSDNVLVELIRVAHRQFIWQSNSPNHASIIRYFTIFNRPIINQLCEARFGLNVWQIFMCGLASMGHFLTHPAMAIPFNSEIKALPVDAFDKFFQFTSSSLRTLKKTLSSEQKYDSTFPYAYSSIRASPLIRMPYLGKDSFVCPLMTLLYWKFTGGLYYELIQDPNFGNEFGEGFQLYVGEVVERACPSPTERYGEQVYIIGKSEKRSVDWIIADADAALFLECKARRLSWGAKVSLTDLAPLEADIENMAAAVVQVYRTLADHLDNAYPHFPAKDGRKIFPTIVTLESWHLFGPVMLGKLSEAVLTKLSRAGLPLNFIEKWPYSIWAIQDLEIGLQIMQATGIVEFMEAKLNSDSMRQWEWYPYMSNRYFKSFPPRKLFERDYDNMFSELYKIQRS